jgi:hypothetical protein
VLTSMSAPNLTDLRIVEVRELIYIEHYVGAAVKGDPGRIAVAVFAKDGQLIAWRDPMESLETPRRRVDVAALENALKEMLNRFGVHGDDVSDNAWTVLRSNPS